MAASAERRRGAQPSELPLAARRALWARIWDRLLAPEDLRDPAEVPASARKDTPPEAHDGGERPGGRA